MKNHLLSLLLLLFSFQSVTSQIIVNKEKLQQLSSEYHQKSSEQRIAVEEYARINNISIRVETDSTLIQLMYIDENGMPQYYATYNENAAKTISTDKVYTGGAAGLSLSGVGITVHEWDGGTVLETHQEFDNRVTNGDATPTHYHATHVAGTIMASGVQSAAKGMAFSASLKAYDWTNDESEMASEAAAGALVSNHSYGYITGWYWNGSAWNWQGNTSISTDEDYLFGFYDTQAENWDDIAYNAPNYLIVKSAGNDRGDGPSGGTYPQDGPYDCIGHSGISKNVLTVGAVNDIEGGWTQASDVVMSSFSSWGPADDGRIKPDIVANGIGLYSAYNTANDDYASLSGTSMSSPSVTGSVALLIQHYENIMGTGSVMRAATMKALIINTADEAGPDDGPDYMFGWGLMNTQNAAAKISENQTSDVIVESTLNNGESYTQNITTVGTNPIKVTVVWTDPAGTPPSASLDPSDIMLVNDLDLKITQGANTYYPWKLDVNNPSNAATQLSKNNVDNVEEVYIASPSTATTYTITVNHDGALSGGSQAFSMIISLDGDGNDDPTSFSSTAVNSSQINLSWNKNTNNNSVLIAYSESPTFGTPVDGNSYSVSNTISGGGTVLYKGSNETFSHTNLEANTTYYYKAWSIDGSNNYSSGVITNSTTLIGNFLPPTNLLVTEDGYATWEAPEGSEQELIFITQNPGEPANGYFQSYDNAYGVIFDFSEYPDALANSIEFHHSSWELTGTWDYKIHIVNWDTQDIIASLGEFSTTGNDTWENNIPLDNINLQGATTVAFLMEPLSNASDDAYPDISADNDENPQGSVFGPLNDLSSFGASTIGNFLMNVYIMTAYGETVMAPRVLEIPTYQNTNTRISNNGMATESIISQTSSSTNKNRSLTGYNIYLDVALTGNTGNLYWQYSNLTEGETYTAGVSALYNDGESDIIEFEFTVPEGNFLTVTPSNQDVGSSAGTTEFIVNTNTAWTAISDASWCSVTASGNGDGTLVATYEENTSISSRIATITMNASGLSPVQVTVSQAGSNSTLSVTPSNQNVSSLAGTTDFMVSTNAAWTAISNATWCSVPSYGNGDGTIVATYEENTSISSRIATITVSVDGSNSVEVTVSQSGTSPILTISPSNQNVNSLAGTTNFTINSNSSWLASSNSSWCNVTSSGNGDGTLVATYEENTSISSRIAIITVSAPGLSPIQVTVTQTGSSPTLIVTPPNQDVGSSTGTTSYTVNSNAAWTSSSNASWCSVTSSGNGDGTLIATYEENTSISYRVAILTVTVSGLSPVQVTVSQSGANPTLIVTPPNQNVSALAGTTDFMVTTNSPWTASSNASWCSVPSSGNGDSPLIATYEENTSTSSRIAIITISVSGINPVQVTVTQSETNPTLTVSPSNQDVSALAGTTDFMVSTNSAWTANSNASWCTVPMSGNGDGTLIATYEENTSISSRIATISVSVDGSNPVQVTVSQSGTSPVLTVTPSNQEVSSLAGNTNFSVNSNSSWVASCNTSWCTVTTSGEGNGNIIATYQENTSISTRISIITVTVSGLSPVQVTVTQSGSSPTLSVSPPNYDVSHDAGTSNFMVTSNSEWTATSDASWCTANPSPIMPGILIATYEENTSPSMRIASITVSVSGLEAEIVTVTQEEAPTGLENKPASNIQIIPNPSSGYFKVKTNSADFVQEIKIIDLTGRIVLISKYINESEYSIDLSEAPAGTYFIEVKTTNKIFISKIILHK